jgi:hypothetical protein
MIDWERATLEQRIDQLRNEMITRQQLSAVVAQIQELEGAIGQLQRRVNALENRPAVGS